MDKLVDYTPEELAELFTATSKEAAQIEAAMEPVESMNRDIRILLANKPPEKMSGGAKFGYGFMFFSIFGIFSLIVGAATSETVGGTVGITAFTLPFVFVYLMNKKKKQTYADWEIRLAALHEQVRAQDVVLAQTIARVADKIMLIPEEYRYSFALDTMQGYLKNFRASNWRDCMNLFEEQKHRWLLEQNSNEGLLLQRQMAQSAERAASSAEAAAFFGAVTAVNTGILAHQAAKQ